VLTDPEVLGSGLALRDHARRTISEIDGRFVTRDRCDCAFDGLANTQRPKRALSGLGGEQLLHRHGIDGHVSACGQGTCHIHSRKPERGGPPVNSTARWPKRLEHLAWLLRAEAVAVVVATADPPSTVFSHRIETADWHAILGSDAFARAAGGAFAVSVPAGRWGEEAAFAVVAPIETWNGPAVLCALRREVPFDALDVVAATSAAGLLAMMASDGRDLAGAQRHATELDERLDVLGGIGDGLVDARDASAALARAAAEVARRMGAGATSIMLVEGGELRLRAAVGLPKDVQIGRGQRLGEGIAGWVAASGEKIVLRGRVTDERFHGVDPDARESISVPLRVGDDVLGVLSVKRPQDADGFSETLLDGIAADLSRALQAMNMISALQRERERAEGMADVALAVAAGDAHGAARAAAESFRHHAVALRSSSGKVLAVHADQDDPDCRAAALSASESVGGTDAAGATSVGFARHDPAYEPDETETAQHVADTLALLGRAEIKRERGAVLRVLAVEDHPVMQLGVRALLERAGLIVVGLTSTCSEAVGLLEDAQPDVVLCDLHLPDADGAEAIARLRAEAPALPIVAFSIDRSPELIRAVIRAGGNGYVSKDTPASRVIAALHAAVEGLVPLGREAASSIAKASPTEPPRGPQEADEPESPIKARDAAVPNGATPNGVPPNGSGEYAATHEALTPRELELLRYMAEGYTNKEVARAMVLAEDTVKKGVQMLIAKLGAADRTHAVVLALRNHLID
jgi:DNA-binding NarL/FixJ family response regulator/putative methionine-R-sulfoxide reductase with GAF domain